MVRQAETHADAQAGVSNKNAPSCHGHSELPAPPRRPPLPRRTRHSPRVGRNAEVDPLDAITLATSATKVGMRSGKLTGR
jgi:hypothetical protein